MDTPHEENELLKILRNIEQNTEQKVSTTQNVDEIKPLSVPLNPSYQLVAGYTKSTAKSLLRNETYSFDIPSEAPHVLVPACSRSLALYRNNDKSPFAFVQAGQTRSFLIPHLERLTVEVLPGYASGFAVLFASSRPLDVSNDFAPSPAIAALPYTGINPGTTQYSYAVPVVSNANVQYAFMGDSPLGTTDVHVQAYGVNELQLSDDSLSPNFLIPLAPEVVYLTPFTGPRNILLNPPRLVVFAVWSVGGPLNGYLDIQYVG